MSKPRTLLALLRRRAALLVALRAQKRALAAIDAKIAERKAALRKGV